MYLSDSGYEDYNNNATENIQGHSQTSMYISIPEREDTNSQTSKHRR